jgi:hypothetical protein
LKGREPSGTDALENAPIFQLVWLDRAKYLPGAEDQPRAFLAGDELVGE